MPEVSPLLLTFSSIQFRSALVNTDQVSPLFKTFDTTRVRVATLYASVRSDSSFRKRLKVQLIGHRTMALHSLCRTERQGRRLPVSLGCGMSQLFCQLPTELPTLMIVSERERETHTHPGSLHGYHPASGWLAIPSLPRR